MSRHVHVTVAAALGTILVLAGCSSSSHTTNPSATSAPAGATTPTTRAPMAPGPAAVLSGPITGGKGIALTESVRVDLAKLGYSNKEYFATGNATEYKSAGAQGSDGKWTIAAQGTAAYRTRIIVRVPTNPKNFNGTLLVEWLNVTAGSDTDPVFAYAGNEITRRGYGWVGVSVQKVGVSGGGGLLPIAGVPAGGLVGTDPARYGSLHHPGDQYALDIFSQVARALRAPSASTKLDGLEPARVLAIGESQSAFELTTYIDAIQPTARIFDGFFVYSRGGGATPLAGGGGGAQSALTGGVRIRDDIDVPVFLFETETDEAELGYFNARQPDGPNIRLWDVAGAAHADAYIVGGNAAVLTTVLGCTGSVNTAPTHYLVAAALSHLDAWVRTSTPPPSAPRMQVALVKGAPVVQRDAMGNAIGGVRTGANDVPVATLSGDAPKGTKTICALFGSTKPFSAATLARLYPTEADYLAKFTKATDAAIAEGYLLPADRAQILAEAAKVKV